MDYRFIITAALTIAAPLLARKGVILPEGFGSWIGALGTFIAGLVANGFKDTRTTIVGIVGGVASGAVAGLGADPATQAAASSLFLTILGWLHVSPIQTPEGK